MQSQDRIWLCLGTSLKLRKSTWGGKSGLRLAPVQGPVYTDFQLHTYRPGDLSILWSRNLSVTDMPVPAVIYHIKRSLYVTHQGLHPQGLTRNHCCNPSSPFFLWSLSEHGNTPRCLPIDNPAGKICPSRINKENQNSLAKLFANET